MVTVFLLSHRVSGTFCLIRELTLSLVTGGRYQVVGSVRSVPTIRSSIVSDTYLIYFASSNLHFERFRTCLYTSLCRGFTLSRVIVGIFRQFSTVSKAALCEASSPDDRITAISYLYLALSVGFMVGPALGGVLAEKYGIRTVIALACSVFTCNGALVHVVMNEIKPICLDSKYKPNNDNIRNFADASETSMDTSRFDSQRESTKSGSTFALHEILSKLSVATMFRAAASSFRRIVSLPQQIRNLMVRCVTTGRCTYFV